MSTTIGTGIQPTPRQARQPRRSKLGGAAIIVAAPIIACALFLWLISFDLDGRLYVVGFVMLLVAMLAAIRTGRQLRAPDALEVLRRDPRPPVVFLRPFDEDSRTLHATPVGQRQGGARPESSSGRGGQEHTLALLFRSVGPFIAIGRPGESLATLGAARTYVSDDVWKQEVEALVRRAGAIVLQPELSSGTVWEIELIARRMDRQRLLLVVPNPALRPLRYGRVRLLVEECLGIVLPLAELCMPCDAFYFDHANAPVPLVLCIPHLAVPLATTSIRLLLRLALDRVAAHEVLSTIMAEMPLGMLRTSKTLTRAAAPFLEGLIENNWKESHS